MRQGGVRTEPALPVLVTARLSGRPPFSAQSGPFNHLWAQKTRYMAARHWWYFGLFVTTSILSVGASMMGMIDGLSALPEGAAYGEEFAPLLMLQAGGEWLVASMVLGLFSMAFLTATVVSVLRNRAFPRDDRIASVVERLERRYPILQEFDVSKRFEPTPEERKKELKAQYVEGELSEAEFERRMEQVMDGDVEKRETTTRSRRYASVEVED